MSKRTGAANLSAYKRRKYAELKNDPEMYKREKEKERLRYIKKKKKGKLSQLTKNHPGIKGNKGRNGGKHQRSTGKIKKVRVIKLRNQK